MVRLLQIFPPFLKFVFYHFMIISRVVQTKMPNFRETRACIAYAYRNNFLKEQEFVLLYDAHKSKNPEFPYWNYERFDLDEKTNDECKVEFRFYRDDIYKLAEQLQLPALCMYLKRYAYLADTKIWFTILPDRFLRFLS